MVDSVQQQYGQILIENGDVQGLFFLGRYFSVGGKVVRGCTAANNSAFRRLISSLKKSCFQAGVYAVKVCSTGSIHDGACNIGFNPTFNNGRFTVEVHLLDFEGDLYGRS
jgi:riboflavin kinase/FMN adenylyltransferase